MYLCLKMQSFQIGMDFEMRTSVDIPDITRLLFVEIPDVLILILLPSHMNSYSEHIFFEQFLSVK